MSTTDGLDEAGRRRPFGVVVLTVGVVLTGLTGLLVAGVIAIGEDMAWEGVPLLGEWTLVMSVDRTPTLVVGIVSGIVGLTCLAVAVGFWRLRSWGWTGVVLLSAITLTINLVAVVLGDANEASLIVAILTVLYVNQRRIQLLFRGEHLRAFESSTLRVRTDA